MDGTCHHTDSGHLVLVSSPSDYAMQALLGGTLEFGEKYLSLRTGEDLTPVFLPPGTTLETEPDSEPRPRPAGCQLPARPPRGMRLRIGDHVFRVGDEITGSGGYVDVHGDAAPAGSGLAAGDPVVIMHDAWPTRLSDRMPPPAEVPPLFVKRRRRR